MCTSCSLCPCGQEAASTTSSTSSQTERPPRMAQLSSRRWRTRRHLPRPDERRPRLGGGRRTGLARMRSFHVLGKKIIGVASNYKCHIQEMKSAIPKEPIFFLKPTSSYVLEPHPIMVPEGHDVHHEGRMGPLRGRACMQLEGAVVAQRCRQLPSGAWRRHWKKGTQHKGRGGLFAHCWLHACPRPDGSRLAGTCALPAGAAFHGPVLICV